MKLGHNRFWGLKFQDMSELVGNRQLAFNLLILELGETKEPEESMGLTAEFFAPLHFGWALQLLVNVIGFLVAKC